MGDLLRWLAVAGPVLAVPATVAVAVRVWLFADTLRTSGDAR